MYTPRTGSEAKKKWQRRSGKRPVHLTTNKLVDLHLTCDLPFHPHTIRNSLTVVVEGRLVVETISPSHHGGVLVSKTTSLTSQLERRKAHRSLPDKHGTHQIPPVPQYSLPLLWIQSSFYSLFFSKFVTLWKFAGDSF